MESCFHFQACIKRKVFFGGKMAHFLEEPWCLHLIPIVKMFFLLQFYWFSNPVFFLHTPNKAGLKKTVWHPLGRAYGPGHMLISWMNRGLYKVTKWLRFVETLAAAILCLRVEEAKLRLCLSWQLWLRLDHHGNMQWSIGRSSPLATAAAADSDTDWVWK